MNLQEAMPVPVRIAESIVEEIEEMYDHITKRAYEIFRERSGFSTLDLEDWLASTVRQYAGDTTLGGGDLQHVLERLRATLDDGGSNRGTTVAMTNLADAIQSLVAHMRSEQEMIREWADSQGEQNIEIKKLLERIARQPEKS